MEKLRSCVFPRGNARFFFERPFVVCGATAIVTALAARRRAMPPLDIYNRDPQVKN